MILKLRDEDDYLRLISFRILIDLSSKHLQGVMDILKNDEFNYIQDKIKEIRLKGI